MVVIACDTVTIWHRSGSSWRRSVVTGVRTEHSHGTSAAQVGPEPSRELKVYFFRNPGVSEGDWMATGAVSGAEPPDDALRVCRIAPWTLNYRFHHVEVTCR